MFASAAIYVLVANGPGMTPLGYFKTQTECVKAAMEAVQVVSPPSGTSGPVVGQPGINSFCVRVEHVIGD
jgi:hypothetical protein